jgi:hypothetical protein
METQLDNEIWYGLAPYGPRLPERGAQYDRFAAWVTERGVKHDRFVAKTRARDPLWIDEGNDMLLQSLTLCGMPALYVESSVSSDPYAILPVHGDLRMHYNRRWVRQHLEDWEKEKVEFDKRDAQIDANIKRYKEIIASRHEAEMARTEKMKEQKDNAYASDAPTPGASEPSSAPKQAAGASTPAVANLAPVMPALKPPETKG